MSTLWIVILSVLVLGQTLLNLFFFFLLVSLAKKVDVYWEGVKSMAELTDKNFAKTGKFIDEIAQFLVRAFNLDIPKMQKTERVSPPDGGFKN